MMIFTRIGVLMVSRPRRRKEKAPIAVKNEYLMKSDTSVPLIGKQDGLRVCVGTT